MPTYRLTQLRLPFEDGLDPLDHSPHLRKAAAAHLGLPEADLGSVVPIQRSLDARKRPTWVLTCDVTLEAGTAVDKLNPAPTPWQPPALEYTSTGSPRGHSPNVIVVGAGPAGLACAHLLAHSGLSPIILEQGSSVAVRGKAVAALINKGSLNTACNLNFGEGGAGTYSDGKLYTRRRDPRVAWLIELMARLCGQPTMALEAHPHVGTDRLVPMLRRWRELLTDLGARFVFEARVQRLLLSQGRVQGVVLDDGLAIEASRVVVAPGNSARRLWESLHAQGVAMEAVPFAVGVRMEHPQELIDQWRYGTWATRLALPPAEYSLTGRAGGSGAGGRPCHTFCMCPGGSVVPTPTEPGGLAINGMSGSKRSGRLANAAAIVEVRPDDLPSVPGPRALAGVEFQRYLEQAAYQAGGGQFVAPAQRLTDFLANRGSTNVAESSYRRGLAPGDLTEILPAWVCDSLRANLAHWCERHRQLGTHEATLIAVESRPSSPVRLLRGDDCLSVSTPGLYPCGEGAGYASGITACALDGLRVAQAILDRACG